MSRYLVTVQLPRWWTATATVASASGAVAAFTHWWVFAAVSLTCAVIVTYAYLTTLKRAKADGKAFARGVQAAKRKP